MVNWFFVLREVRIKQMSHAIYFDKNLRRVSEFIYIKTREALFDVFASQGNENLT